VCTFFLLHILLPLCRLLLVVLFCVFSIPLQRTFYHQARLHCFSKSFFFFVFFFFLLFPLTFLPCVLGVLGLCRFRFVSLSNLKALNRDLSSGNLSSPNLSRNTPRGMRRTAGAVRRSTSAAECLSSNSGLATPTANTRSSFPEMTLRDWDLLSVYSLSRCYAAGDTIFEQGNPQGCLYLIKRYGCVGAYRVVGLCLLVFVCVF
jgi:hypothetical protein